VEPVSGDNIVSRMSAGLARAELIVVVVLFVLLLAAGLTQVFTRYALDSSFTWTEELCRSLFIWATFLGASASIAFRREIKVDVLDLALSPLARRRPSAARRVEVVADVLAPTVAFCFVVLLGYLAYDLVAFQAEAGSTSVQLGVPNWVVTAVLPVAMVLSAFHYLAAVIDVVANARRRAAVQEGAA
jgi:TRAP-type C4-dicarboxylate transport system permease small subunit